MSKKTALTFEEKLAAAYVHYVHGIDQHIVALLYGINQGRINEACTTIREALNGKAKPEEELHQ